MNKCILNIVLIVLLCCVTGDTVYEQAFTQSTTVTVFIYGYATGILFQQLLTSWASSKKRDVRPLGGPAGSRPEQSKGQAE